MRRWVPIAAAAALVLTTAIPAAAAQPGGSTTADGTHMVTGEVRHVAQTLRDGTGLELTLVVAADGQVVRVPNAELAGVPTGATVTIERPGDAPLGDDGAGAVLAAAPAQAPAEPAGLAAASPLVSGDRPVYAYVGTIGSQASDGVDADDLASDIAGQVAPYWGESTGGEIDFAMAAWGAAPAYTGWGSTATCTDTQLTNLLDWIAGVAGMDEAYGTGEHGVLYTPVLAACEFASISYIDDGGTTWINGTGDDPRWVSIAHEFGHTLTLGDSDTRILCKRTAGNLPTRADGTSAECTDGVQGDAYDVMGFRTEGLPGVLNGAQLDALGLLTDANSIQAEGSGTVLLAPVGGLTGQRFLVIETNLVTYYVEYREPVGRDADLATGKYGCPYGVYDCDPGSVGGFTAGS